MYNTYFFNNFIVIIVLLYINMSLYILIFMYVDNVIL
jgi:hypothetical protein